MENVKFFVGQYNEFCDFRFFLYLLVSVRLGEVGGAYHNSDQSKFRIPKSGNPDRNQRDISSEDFENFSSSASIHWPALVEVRPPSPAPPLSSQQQ